MAVPSYEDEKVGAISNASGLGTELGDWPKVMEGKKHMSSLLGDRTVGGEDALVDKLFEIMR